MKKRLLAFLLILVVAVFAFSACNTGVVPPEEDDTNTPETPSTPEEPETPDNPTEEPKEVTLSLYDVGRDAVVKKYKVAYGEALTEEQVNTVKEYLFNGYGYLSWHTSSAFADSNLFDFSTVLDSNTTIYGNRGSLAGWNITYNYDAENRVLSFVGSGDMFDFKNYEDVLWRHFAKPALTISIDENITSIGGNAFCQFNSLTNVVIPSNISYIGDAAFEKSTVGEINFPTSLKHIGERAFFGCRNLVHLKFNEGLEYIGHSAFYECSGVVDVVLTNKIAELGFSAFAEAVSLKSAYYIGTKEQYDEINFRLNNFWINKLANTYFIAEEKPDEVGPYWYYDENGDIKQWFYTVGFMASSKETVPFAFAYVDPEIGLTQEHIEYMNNLVYRGYKFKSWNGRSYGIRKVKAGVKLNGDIRLIGSRGNLCGDDMTFSIEGTTLYINGTGRMWDFEKDNDSTWFNQNITNVVIGTGVEYIGKFAFSSIEELKYIDIPSNVKGIHANAIAGCNNFKYIYYEGNYEESLEVDGLYSLFGVGNAKVHCYTESMTEGEGSFYTIINDITDKRVAWELKDGVLTVGGDESLVNYASKEDTPWYSMHSSVNEVIIVDGANRVGAHSFEGYENLVKITVPKSVGKIAESAFLGSAYYTNADNWENGALYISDGDNTTPSYHLIKVNKNAVGDTFVIKSGTISVAERAFDGCVSIRKLVISKDMTSVYSSAFTGLTELSGVFYNSSSVDAYNSLLMHNSKGMGALEGITVYYLSNKAPSTEGNFWHFVSVGGVNTVEIWETVTQ